MEEYRKAPARMLTDPMDETDDMDTKLGDALRHKTPMSESTSKSKQLYGKVSQRHQASIELTTVVRNLLPCLVMCYIVCKRMAPVG